MSHLTSEDFSEITPEDQYPQTINVCSPSQWKQNWKCVLLTCLIFSCLVSVLFCHRMLPTQVTKNSKDPHATRNIRWTLIFCSLMFYSLYLMECSHATDTMQLCYRNTPTLDRVKEKIERMKNSDPVIWWKATCYHFTRRKRRTTQYRRGTYFVSNKVYQERVNSFTSGSTFNFSCCGVKDISNNLALDASSGSIVKFRFSKGFAFANMASAVEFEEQRSMFFRELRRYDDYMEIHEGLDLTDCPAFEEEVVALNTSGKRPWFANPFYYWLYSCCLLSWPFRLILSHNTVQVHYKITKLFGVNYNNLSDSAQHLTLLQLYGSYSVDENVETPVWSSDIGILDESTADLTRGNSALVPSYSEAILLDDHEALIPETRSAQNISLEVLNKDNARESASSSMRRNARIRYYASTGVLHSSFRSSVDSDSTQPFLHDPEQDDGNEEESPPAMVATTTTANNPDHPPTYEEALMLPVVEHARQSIAAAAASSRTTGNQHTNQNYSSPDHAQSEIRLPNVRTTFLSIETSL